MAEASKEPIVGKTFTRETITFPGKAYIDCTFDNCIMEFDGSEIHADGCTFKHCKWGFVGAAGNTVMLIKSLAASPGGESITKAVLLEIFGSAEAIRKMFDQR